MKLFTKSEALIISGILLVISTVSFFNFRTALTRSRDAQRKADIGAIVNGLEAFSIEFGFYPLSTSDGKIRACQNDGAHVRTAKLNVVEYLLPCEYGVSPMVNVFNPEQIFMQLIPPDPKSPEGVSYHYISNGNIYQIFVHLESEDDPENVSSIANRGIYCGTVICNYGKASASAPLDITIEEYEQILERERKGKL